MRELTKNEKNLLTILGIILIGWGSYHFIITPQSQKLEALKGQKLEYQTKIDENHAIMSQENNVKEKLYILGQEQDELASQYFSKLDQPQITYLLNDLLAVDHIEILDMSIDVPDYEAFGESQVKKLNVSISYAGDYMGVIDMLKSLKNSPKKILIDSVSMDRDDEGSLWGDVALRIYGLDDLVSEGEELMMVHSGKRELGKTPFTAYSGYVESNDTTDDLPAGLNPYSPEFSVDYEKESAISVMPGEERK